MIGKQKTLKKMLDKSLFEKQIANKKNPLLENLTGTFKSNLGKEYEAGEVEAYYVLLATAVDEGDKFGIKVVVVLEEEFDKYQLSRLNANKKSTLMPIVELVNDEV